MLICLQVAYNISLHVINMNLPNFILGAGLTASGLAVRVLSYKDKSYGITAFVYVAF